MIELERRVDVIPGYCMFHKEPSKDYGISACRIVFYVIGPKGAVQLMIGTDWYNKAAREHLSHFPRSAYDDEQPKGWDIGYHSKVPLYEDQTARPCHILGGECYYDGSSLNADDWIEGFINGGADWLWPKLEEYYNFTFESGKHPDLTPVIRKNPHEEAA